MQRKKASLRILLVSTAILTFLAFFFNLDPKEGRASLTMLDVGQGDSFLIEGVRGSKILIDGGKDSKVLMSLSKVLANGDREIDVVIATHPDADHIGGLIHVLSRYRVSLFLTTEAQSDSEVFSSLWQEVKKKNIPAFYVRRGMKIELKDESLPSTLSILFPDRSTSTWQTNSASIVARLDIGKNPISTSALFTGDSPSSVEHYLGVLDPKSLDVDILKLSHHGSKTSSSEEFLRLTSPLVALISAGVGNSYGHPAPETMGRLEKYSISPLSTIEHGSVRLFSDGVRWTKETQK